MPNYPALAAQGIYSDPATGMRVFAGQRAETFYIDLGAVFDTLNLRRYLPLLTGAGEDADNVNPFGVNRFSGANVSTIALEVPITRLTSDGLTAANTVNPVIGMYAGTSRKNVRVLQNGDARQHGALDSGVADGQSAGQRAHHHHAGQGRLEHGGTGRRSAIPGLLQNPVIATALELVYHVPILPIDGSPAPTAPT